MHCLQEHETEDLAKARDSLKHVQRIGIMRLGRRDHGQLQIPQPLVIIVDQSEVDCDALRHGGIRQPLSHTSAAGFGGDLLTNLGHIVGEKNIVFVGFPLAIADRSGAPMRAAALVY